MWELRQAQLEQLGARGGYMLASPLGMPSDPLLP